MGKADARKLSPEVQQQLRNHAIHLRKKGWKYKTISEAVGVHFYTVAKWCNAYNKGGDKAIRIQKRGRKDGMNRTLSTDQEAKIRQSIRDKCPEQLKLPFALWTRRAIQQLIKRLFSVNMPIRTVGEYLKRWGYTPQKPLRCAYEQNPKAVQKWMEEEYPSIQAKAKEEKAEIHWGEGGGMYNVNCSPLVASCVFVGNVARLDGGGMYNKDCSPNVINCTFSGNDAVLGLGGGIYNWCGAAPTVTNCILWANTAAAYCGSPYSKEICGSPGNPAVTYCDVQDGYPGTGNINADPLFFDPTNGDFRLTAKSPGLDAGNNTAVPVGITEDFEGESRMIDDPTVADTGNGTAPIVDMGADERSASGPIAPIPEVATIVLMGVGLVALGGFVWYRRQKATALV